MLWLRRAFPSATLDKILTKLSEGDCKDRAAAEQRFSRLVETDAPPQGAPVRFHLQQVRVLLGGNDANVGTVTYQSKDTRHRHPNDSTTCASAGGRGSQFL